MEVAIKKKIKKKNKKEINLKNKNKGARSAFKALAGC